MKCSFLKLVKATHLIKTHKNTNPFLIFMSDEIIEKQKEIEKLKQDLKEKEEFFELLDKDNKRATKQINTNFKLQSYFSKFKYSKNLVGLPSAGLAWLTTYYYKIEDEVLEDFNRLKKEIEEKENRLEQKIYLQKQQKYLKLQTQEIKEESKNRERLKNFTFVLAFGVILSGLYALYSILSNFAKEPTWNSLAISAIFFLAYGLALIFIGYNFKINEEIKDFWKSHTLLTISFILFILIITLCLFFIPEHNIKENPSDKINQNLENIAQNLSAQNEFIQNISNNPNSSVLYLIVNN